MHRRDTFRAAPEAVHALKKACDDGKLHLRTPYQLKELHGNVQAGHLTHVTLQSTQGETEKVPADIMLPCFGLKADLGPIADWGLHLEKKCIQIDPTTAATNVEGIYAVVDMATYHHKLKLILTGFAEAAQAAASIRRQLFPEQPTILGHSTSLGVPELTD